MWHFLITAFFLLLLVRTSLWWINLWQSRGYSWARIWDHFHSADGQRNLKTLWFFPQFVQLPHFTKRILFIIIVWLLMGYLVFQSLPVNTHLWVRFLILDRLSWLTVSISAYVSKLPALYFQQQLFDQAESIRRQAKNLIVIGLTGSYGKSSTKEILVHLFTEHFGIDAVLSTPENKNTELSIASLIVNNKDFFTKNTKKRFFIVEMGAYRRGELRQMCHFVAPDQSIITAVGRQHLCSFGSQRNIQIGKFELAQCTTEHTWYNADNDLLREIFENSTIQATSHPVSVSDATSVVNEIDRNTFAFHDTEFVLPWGGKFFVQNALLALSVAKQNNIPFKKAAAYLTSLKPLERALSVKSLPSGATAILDPYGQNPAGVHAAIDHLGTFSGKKIYIGIPLLELGSERKTVHTEIFTKLADIGATVFWMGEDFATLGKSICGTNFHHKDTSAFTDLAQKLGKNDALLVESRVSEDLVRTVPGLEDITLAVPH